MSHSIALHWNQHTLHAVVVRQHVGHRQVEAVLSLPIETGGDVSGTARRLTEALAPYSPARANIVVAVGREVLSWQHLSLPPCPGEDLADVVRLQALQDSPSAANDVGFDFLPLVGDQQTSHRVWAVALQPFELEKILNVCQSANLKPDRIVPLSLGYPPLAEKSGPGGDAASRVYIAPYGEEATLWTMIGARTILFRQLQLPTPTQPSAQIAAIASEIQRTKLALSQQQPVADIDSVWLVGCKNDECLQLAKALSTALEEQV
ncbi:MAG: hypothetical protein MI725_07935 [Pirellulales bacterium]|nr:hypothetical protein [Pirellulales bacterium]